MSSIVHTSEFNGGDKYTTTTIEVKACRLSSFKSLFFPMKYVFSQSNLGTRMVRIIFYDKKGVKTERYHYLFGEIKFVGYIFKHPIVIPTWDYYGGIWIFDYFKIKRIMKSSSYQKNHWL